MKNFGKYLVLLLTFLSIGGASCYGNTLPEIREERPLSSEDLKAASSAFWAYRENPFQKISDLSENYFFGSTSVTPQHFSYNRNPAKECLKAGFERDLRQIISKQIFPKHFFL